MIRGGGRAHRCSNGVMGRCRMDSNLRVRWHLRLALLGSLFVCIGVLIASEIGHLRVQNSFDKVIREVSASAKLAALLGCVSDAETSQRGYLLTDRADYLETYTQVLPKIEVLVNELRLAYGNLPDRSMLSDFDALTTTLREKMSELDVTLKLAQQNKKLQARELLLTDIGLEKMEELRAQTLALQTRERQNTLESMDQRYFNHQMTRLAVAIVTVLNVALLVLLFRWLRADWGREQERKKRLEDQQVQLDRLVAERTSQLEILTSHLQQVSETEKASLARELHDELGAILTASKMDVSWVRQHLAADQSALGEKLARALKNLDQGVQAKRRLIENLVPSTLTTFGLVVALRELIETMQGRTGWALELDLPDDDLRLPNDASIALFRMAQEAINNAAKYASAKTVCVRLTCLSDAVLLSIQDDGVGFNARDMRPKSYGLVGMRQRMIGLGGTLLVDSEVGKGTQVRASLPLAAEKPQDMPDSQSAM
jgi:signal transduction histidine kinase